MPSTDIKDYWRRSWGIGDRQPFADAGLADPANNIKVGQALGDGIIQKIYTNAKGIKTPAGYEVTVGGPTGKKKLKTGFSANYDKAKKIRVKLLKEYGELGTGGKATMTWEKLSKETGFLEFMDDAIKNNKYLQQAMKESGLTAKSPKEKIFTAFKKMVADHNALGKRALKISPLKKLPRAAFSNFLNTFFKTFQPKHGSLNFDDLAKELPISRHKIKDYIYDANKELPSIHDHSRKAIMQRSRILKANQFEAALKNAGITLKRVGSSWRINATKSQIDNLKNNFKFDAKTGTYDVPLADQASQASKKTKEWKTKNYSKDLSNIKNLVRNMNNKIKFLTKNGTEFGALREWIAANPKLLDLVEATFDAEKGIMTRTPLNKLSNEALWSRVQFEKDHIRPRKTVKFDKATKKILDGLGIEFPKNLYIVPSNINNTAKRAVETYVEAHPKETKKIKALVDWFKKRDLSFYDSKNKRILGATPQNTSTDIKRLGIDLKKFLSDKSVYRGQPVIENGEKLLKLILERNTFLNKDVAVIKDFAAKNGISTNRFNSFAGFVDLNSMGIELPPSVKKALNGVLKVGGKVLKVAGVAGWVAEPLFAAYNFSDAIGQGVSGGEAAIYTGSKFVEDIVNLPGLAIGATRWAKDKLTGQGEKAGPFEYLPTKTKFTTPYDATFARERLKKDVAKTPENVKLRRIAEIEFDNTMSYMVDVMDMPGSSEELEIKKDIFLKEKLGENYKITHPKHVEEEKLEIKETDNIFGTSVPTKNLTGVDIYKFNRGI